MTMIKGSATLDNFWQSALPATFEELTPKFHRMMVDCDLCVSSFCNAWELTHEQLGFVPDTLVIAPGDFADWVLNLSERFRAEGYNFIVLVNPHLKPDSWFVAQGNRIGFGSYGA